MNWIESICNLNEKVRQDHPLIHHITNLVVTNVTANVTLAVGAAPVMLGAVEDAAAMTQHAQALVLNCGTLSPDSVEAMLAAGQAANENNIPVVLDPVAIGTTPFRTEMILKILQQVKCTVIRGNSSEMGFLAGKGVRPRGVDARPDDHLDSTALDKDRSELAAKLDGKYSATAAVTGRYNVSTTGSSASITAIRSAVVWYRVWPPVVPPGPWLRPVSGRCRCLSRLRRSGRNSSRKQMVPEFSG